MKYVSLFAGIGGFDLALNRLGHECVYVNEWDKYSAQTYEKNFGHKPDTRDIRAVDANEIPDHDLLVGGFPCQSFSIAGKRRGFDDTRGTLFFDIARILADKRPRHFILENVKGLLSHDEGKTFQTILGVLSDLGYEYQWQVLNSKNFGVPQNRERVFIVGHSRNFPRSKVFPIGGDEKEANQKYASTALDSNYWKGPDRHAQRTMIATYRHSMDGFKGYEEMSPSIKSSEGSGNQILINNIRRLTPMECERLQGFPDEFTEGVSDTQRYKQLGNAVTVNVVYEVAKEWGKHI